MGICYNNFMERKLTLRYLFSNLAVVLGLVLIWRGLWYILDVFDYWILGGNHLWSAIAGIALGVLILYLPDRDLKEIGKL